MFKKTITYTDYNGEKRTEDFLFNLTTAELMKMELGVSGGFSEMMGRMIAAHDIPTMTKVFDEFIRKSIGQKSPDGKRFIKSTKITDEFCQTEAYSELFMEFISDTDKALEFVNGVIPKDISEQLKNMDIQTSPGENKTSETSEPEQTPAAAQNE